MLRDNKKSILAVLCVVFVFAILGAFTLLTPQDPIVADAASKNVTVTVTSNSDTATITVSGGGNTYTNIGKNTLKQDFSCTLSWGKGSIDIKFVASNSDPNVRFSGWYDGSECKSSESTYTCSYSFSILSSDEILNLEARYEKKESDSKVFIGDQGYKTLEEALTTLKNGNEYNTGTIRVLYDYSIDKDFTVPANVTLLIPYSSADTTGYGEGGSNSRVSWNVSKPPLFVTFTIDSVVTLTVNGTLKVGGVQHAQDLLAQGRTSGAYSHLVNEGSVIVNNGGAIDVRGLVTGSGTITVNDGAKLTQPFMINDFAGGQNATALYSDGQFPFNQFATVNIQCKQVINYGAKVYGAGSLYVDSTIKTQSFLLIGKDSDGALVKMHEGSCLEITYSEKNYVKDTIGGVCLADSGICTISAYGVIDAGKITVDAYNVDSSKMIAPLPYTYKVILKEGAVANIPYAYKLMPGAEITVEEGATANILSGGAVYVYDGLIQAAKSSKQYPQANILAKNGLAKSGMFIVNGKLKIEGKFAGIVQTNGTGEIEVSSGATIGDNKVVDGSSDGYRKIPIVGPVEETAKNKTEFKLPGRVYGLYGFTDLVAGKTYKAYAKDAFTLDTFSVTSADQLDESVWKVTLNQAMSGRFLEYNSTAQKYTATVNFSVNEKLNGKIIKINGQDCLVSGGKTSAPLQFDADGKFSYYTYGKSDDRIETEAALHEGTILLDKDTPLYKAVVSVDLAAGNTYKINEGETFDNIYASVTYGDGTKEDIKLSADTFTPYVKENAQLTCDKLLPLSHNLYIVTDALKKYIASVNALSSLSNDTLIKTGEACYASYLTLIKGLDTTNVNFIREEVGIGQEYESKIAKSVTVNGSITYGNETVSVTVTMLDEKPESKLTVDAAITGFGLNSNNDIFATVVYTSTFAGGYTITKTENANALDVTIDWTGDSFTYNGKEQVPTACDPDGILSADKDYVNVVVTGGQTDAGENYEAIASLEGTRACFYTIASGEKRTFSILAKTAEITAAPAKNNLTTEDTAILFVAASDDLVEADKSSMSFSYQIFVFKNNKDEPIATVAANGTLTIVNSDFSTKNGALKPGNYKVAAVAENPNYDFKFGKRGFTVYPADDYYTITIDQGDYAEYIGSEIKLTATAKNDNGEEETATVITTDIKNAGDYEVEVKVGVLEQVYTFDFTVTPKTITVTWGSKSLKYNGVAQKPTAEISNGELYGDDIVTVAVSSEQDCKNVGNYTAMATLEGTDSGNYTISNSTYDFEITKRILFIKISSAESYYGEDRAEINLTPERLWGADVISEIVTVICTVNNESIAGKYAITLDSTSTKLGKNYNIIYDEGVYTVKPRPVTATVGVKDTVNTDTDKLTLDVTYTTTLADKTPLVNGDTTLCEYTYNIYSGDTIVATVNNLGVLSTKLIPGTYTIEAVGNNNNYNITFARTSFTVQPAEGYYTVEFEDGGKEKSTTYDGSELTTDSNNFDFTVKVGETPVTATVEVVSIKNAAGNDVTIRNVGTYTIKVTVNGFEQLQYELTYTVTKKTIAIVWSDTSSLVYKGSAYTINATLPDIVNGDIVTIAVSSVSGGEFKNAGEYTATATITGDDAGNYEFTNTTVDFTITPAEITVTIGDASSVYGEEIDLSVSLTVTGNFYGENISAIVKLACGATEKSDIGDYEITGTWNDTNYYITFEKGTYTINPRPVTATVSVKDAVDTNTDKLTLDVTYTTTLEGKNPLADGDTILYTYKIYNGEGKEVATADSTGKLSTKLIPGTYTIEAVGNNDNYAVTFSDGKNEITKIEFTVQPAEGYYTVVFDNGKTEKSTTYDGSELITDSNNFDFTVKVGETPVTATVEVVSIKNAAGNDVTIRNVDTYTIKVTVNGFEQLQYELTYKVTSKEIKIDWRNISLVYNSQPQSPTPTLIGIVEDDDVAVTTSSFTNAATYKITATITGNDAGNYEFTNTTVDFTISPAEINVTIGNAESVYGDEIDLSKVSLTVTGKFYGENISAIVNLACEATEKSDIGDYEITGTWNDTNYYITFEKGTYTINPCPVTATVTIENIDTGTKQLDITVTHISGLLEGDSISYNYEIYSGNNLLATAINGVLENTLVPGIYKVKPISQNRNYTVTFYDGENTVETFEFTVVPVNDYYTVVFADGKTEKEYDGKVVNPNIKVTVTDGGTAVSTEEITVTIKNGNGMVAEIRNAGLYEIIVTIGGFAQEYKLYYKVTPKTIEIEWSNTKLVYNAQPQKPSAKIKDGELCGNDNVTVNVSTEGGFENVGSNYKATATLVGTHAGNYTISKDTCTCDFEITKATIEVTITGTGSVYGDKVNAITIETTSELHGKELSDMVNIICEASSTSKVGDYYLITLEVNEKYSNNYEVTYNEAYYTISQRTSDVTVTIKDGTSVTTATDKLTGFTADADNLVNGDTFTFTYKIYSETTLVATVAADGTLKVTSDEFKTKNGTLKPGNYKVSAFAESENYTFKFEKTDFTVSAAKGYYTVEIVGGNSTVYTGSEIMLTATATNDNGGTETAEVYATAVIKNAGTYKVIVKVGVLEQEYSFDFEVTKKVITVVWGNLSLTYNGTAQKPSAKIKDGELCGNDNVTVVVSTESDCINVNLTGKYSATVVLDGDDKDNYALEAGSEKKEFSITPAEITVTIGDASSIYGDKIDLSDVKLAVTKGTLYNDVDIYKIVNLACSATKESPVKTYAITGTGTDANYYITFVNGTYTVNKRSIKIEIEEISGVNTSTTSIAFKTSTTGWVNGDGDSAIYTFIIYRNGELVEEVGSSETLKYKLVPGKYTVKANTANDNYTFTFVEREFVVQPTEGYYEVSIRNGGNSEFNGETFTLDASDFIANVFETKTPETEIILGSISFNGNNVTALRNAGTYTITVKIGPCAQEYTLTYTVTPKTIEIEWSNTKLVYNAQPQSPTATLIGIAEGDNVTVTTNSFTNAGTHTATATLGGTHAGNYTISKDTCTCDFEITKATIEVTITGTGSVYGDDRNAIEIKSDSELHGKELSDMVNIIYSASSTSNVGDYLITLKVNEKYSNNYEVTYNKANYTISQRTSDVTVTIKDGTSVTTATDKLTGFTADADNLVNGNKFTFTYEIYDSANNLFTKATADGTLEKKLIPGSYTVKAVVENADYIGNYRFNIKETKFYVDATDDYYTVTIENKGKSVFDGSEFIPEVTAVVAGTGETVSVKLVSIKTGAIGYEKIRNVGDYTITVEVGVRGKIYKLTYSITKKTVKVIWGKTNLTFNGTAQKPEATVGEGELKDALTLTVNTTGTCKDAGENYKATATFTGANSGNYEFTNTTTNFDISPAEITVKISNDARSAYGDKLVSIQLGLAKGEIFDRLSDIVTASLKDGVTSKSNAGEYEVIVTCKNANYKVTFETGYYYIEKRAITVTIDNKTSIYGDKLEELTAKVTRGSIVDGDENVYTLKPITAIHAGTYVITTDADKNNPNYAITVTNGVYTITQREITVSVANKTSVYGDKLEALTSSLTKGTFAAGDRLELVVELSKTEGENAGEYAITAKSIKDDYKVTFEYTAGNRSIYTIEKRAIILLIKDREFEYTDAIADMKLDISLKTGYTLKDGETLEVLNLTYTIKQNGKKLTEKTLCGGDWTFNAFYSNGNYTVTFENADDETKDYGILSITKPLLEIGDLSAQYTYSGKAYPYYDYETAVTVKANSTSDDFGCEVYFNGRKVDEILNAGTYTVRVILKSSVAFTLKDGTDGSNYKDFTVIVHKKDITDSIKFVCDDSVETENAIYVPLGNYTEIGNSLKGTAIGFRETLTFGGEVSELDKFGLYVFNVTVEDDNYKGEKEFTLNVVASIDVKSANLKKYTEDYKANRTSAKADKVRVALGRLTETDLILFTHKKHSAILAEAQTIEGAHVEFLKNMLTETVNTFYENGTYANILTARAVALDLTTFKAGEGKEEIAAYEKAWAAYYESLNKDTETAARAADVMGAVAALTTVAAALAVVAKKFVL